MLIESGSDFVAADFPRANSFEKHTLGAIAEHEVKVMADRRKAVCAVMRARGLKLAQHLKGSRVHRPDDLNVARAEQLRRAKVRATALAPLLRDLKQGGRSINGIADELTRMDIETPRGGSRWNSPSVERLFRLCGEDPPAKRG
jgi:hypothetical protein